MPARRWKTFLFLGAMALAAFAQESHQHGAQQSSGFAPYVWALEMSATELNRAAEFRKQVRSQTEFGNEKKLCYACRKFRLATRRLQQDCRFPCPKQP